MVSEYSAETFPFQQGWERNENLSVLIPRHSKNLGEPVCAAPLSGPERSPKPPNREMTLPRRGDLLTTHGRPEIAPPPRDSGTSGMPGPLLPPGTKIHLSITTCQAGTLENPSLSSFGWWSLQAGWPTPSPPWHQSFPVRLSQSVSPEGNRKQG